MDKEIRKLRPRLSTVSPLTHWLAVGFVWFNLLIAHIIYVTPGANLVIYRGVFSQTFWALVFCLLSLTIVYGLWSNRWVVVRDAMIVGLFVKGVFLYALIVLAFKYGLQAVEGSLGLWLYLVWAQIGAVMFFLPPIPGESRNVR